MSGDKELDLSKTEPDASPDHRSLPFEEAFARLEGIVRRLEGGEVKLDESLKLFEEGVKLARVCSGRLDAAEGKIRVLLEEDGGLVKEEPFEDLPGAASS